jgi:hypothetical protein
MRLPQQVGPVLQRSSRAPQGHVAPSDFLDDLWSGFTSVMSPFTKVATQVACPLLCEGDKTCLAACRGGGNALSDVLSG